MKAAWTLLFCIVVIVISSCGLQMDRDMAEIRHMNNKIYIDSTINIKKDSENLSKDISDFNAKMKRWRQNNDEFLQSLSNEELKAYSEFIEANRNNNKAKTILTFRNFIDLLQKSDSPKKYTMYKNIVNEGAELEKKENELNDRLQKLVEKEKSLVSWEQSMKEERKHEETVSAIKGISSSIDSMRFDLEQWRMQKFLGMR